MAFKILLVSLLVGLVNGLEKDYTIDARSAFDQQLYESVLDPVLCQEQLNYLSNSSLNLRFLDASAKLPSGFMTGNVNDLGDYWQCLGINEFLDNMQFQGKYCAITAPLNQNPIQLPPSPEWPTLPNITWPGSETEGEETTAEQQYEALRRYALGISGFGRPVESRAIFGLLAFIIIVSTSYDLYCCFVLKNPKAANVLYRSFSVYTNTRRFLTFNTVPGAIECIDGIRAISMMWVVVGHTYSFTLLGYIHNLEFALDWLRKFSSTWINSAPITVDTFFMLSGILAVYTTVGKISRGRFIRTIHLFYLNRLMRMFPLLAAIVLLQASLFNHMSDGPFWLNISQQAENCRKWWWSALLHVQNYVNAVEICIPQSWYLSVDVQLYFFCPIIMVWLFGAELFGWIALCAIVLASLVSSTVYSFLYDFSAALANPSRLSGFNEYVTTYYVNTLCRAPPFFVGMVYGYLLHLCRDKRVRISQLNVILLWSLSFLMMAFCIFSIYPVMQADHEGQIFDNFLNAYMRAIWACALGWLIFACAHGYGGAVNWFLSLSLWKLPARLSFAMYLVHVSIIMIANGSWTKTHYFTEGDNIYRFMSDITLTFIAAFILCICIDAPFSTLQKLLMGGGKKPQQRPKTESRNNIVEEEPEVIKTSL